MTRPRPSDEPSPAMKEVAEILDDLEDATERLADVIDDIDLYVELHREDRDRLVAVLTMNRLALDLRDPRLISERRMAKTIEELNGDE